MVTTAIVSSIYYITIAVLLTVFNKLLFDVHFISPVLILLSQACVTLTTLFTLSHFGVRSSVRPRSFSKSQLLSHLPLAVCHLATLLLGLAALKSTSMLLFHTLRRSGIVITVLLQWHLDGRPPKLSTLLSMLLIVTGGTVTVSSNLRFEPMSYFLAFVCNCTGAYFLTRLKYVRDILDISNLQLLALNNMYSFPVLLAMFALNPPSVNTLVLFYSWKFCAVFICSAVFAVVLNHASYLNTTTNGAITHVICCLVKDLFLLAASVFFIDKPEYRSNGMLLGAAIEFSGSAVYAIGKTMDLAWNKPISHFVHSSKKSAPVFAAQREALLESIDSK